MVRSWFRAHSRGVGLAGLSGVLTFVGYCGFDQFYLSWVSLVPVLWALDRRGLRWRG